MDVSQGTPLSWPIVGGIGYWPVGDIYPLTPVWTERFVDQQLVAAREEPLRHDWMIPYGFDWDIDVTMTDLGVKLDTTWWTNLDDAAAAADDVLIASGYVRTESAIYKSWGWNEVIEFESTLVVDTLDQWTGMIKLGVDVATQMKMGFGTAWQYWVRVILDDGAGEYPVYVMLGHLVVRP